MTNNTTNTDTTTVEGCDAVLAAIDTARSKCVNRLMADGIDGETAVRIFARLNDTEAAVKARRDRLTGRDFPGVKVRRTR